MISIRVVLLERIGDGTISDAACVHVEPIAQMRVFAQRLSQALIRQREHEGRGHVFRRIHN